MWMVRLLLNLPPNLNLPPEGVGAVASLEPLLTALLGKKTRVKHQGQVFMA
jgi:hypothetical protein